jgi:hypothetical protein
MKYTKDENSLNEKRAELIQIATGVLDPRDAQVAARIVDSFCAMSPPLDPPEFMGMITIYSHGENGGRTRKLGNLCLNWRKLAADFGDLSLTVAGTVAEPWLIPFAALSIWNKVSTHSSIELSPNHATVLYAMWNGRNSNNELTEVDAFEKSAVVFKLNNWPMLAKPTFETIIADLESLKCIERRKPKRMIWLREGVQQTYA